MARSLNRVQLIGNLTRDPELRYTPTGTAVVSFSIATNRSWTTDTGEKKDEADFHRIVAWNKLAEICSQFLKKGKKVYVEGRLSTRSWTGQDGAQKSTTEVIISDMILLDSLGGHSGSTRASEPKADEAVEPKSESESVKPSAKVSKAKKETTEKPEEDTKEVVEAPSESIRQAQDEPASESEVAPDDIPF